MLRSLIVAACALACISSVAAFIELDPSTGYFIDSQTGSTQLYHGVNVVYKTAPYLPCMNCPFDPQGSLNEEDMANLVDWGFNMVRLGVMWVAVEPTPGNYNYTFLSEAVALVNKLAEYNITTLIDMHQDLLSPATCGEGIPSWVSDLATTSRACNESWYAEAMHLAGVCKSITEYSIPIDPATGFPSAAECVKHNFALFYATPEVASSFQSLFTNHAGIADAFRRYWSVTAQAFSGIASVIGYDLLNEPFVGDLWQDISEVALPGHSDLKYLQPLYGSLHDVIRSVDKEHLLFYEPTPLPDTLPLFGGIVSPVGFNMTPGTVAGEGPNQDVLSYHVYCCVSAANACDAAGNPVDGGVCDVYNPKNVAMRMKDIARLGGGGFLTEFGACTDGSACLDEITRTTQAADEHFQSTAYWQFKYMNDVTTSSGPAEGFYSPVDGSLVQDKVAALSRTYAQAIQGTPLGMNFNLTTSQFDLTYLSSSTATQPTLIYLNAAWHYPRGFEVGVLQGAGVVATTVDANHVQISHPTGLPAGTTVQVQILQTGESKE